MGQFIATVILLEAAPTAFQNIGYKFWIILIILKAIYGVNQVSNATCRVLFEVLLLSAAPREKKESAVDAVQATSCD
jgi:hypothetical protein